MAVHGTGASDSFEYDVCLSFAGEDRDWVERVAADLRARGIRVFYDAYEPAALWGKDLYEHLDYVYRVAARYCVLFVSADYAEKVWTDHERRSAQARAIGEHREYILPARFDDTETPGLRSTVSYVDLRTTTPEELAELVETKLGPRQQVEFLPPRLDHLFDLLELHGEDEEEAASHHAEQFFRALKRMSVDERMVLMAVYLDGCPGELPNNVHISLDLLRRCTGMPASRLLERLAGLRALGIKCTVRDPEPGDEHELLPEDTMVCVSWSNVTEVVEGEPNTVVYYMVCGALDGYCDHCGPAALERLDFSQLASATAEADAH